jgi:hypothetical protein
MPEHFTRNTVSATFWCSKCGKATMHRVDDRRRGPCFVCMERAPALPVTPQPAPAEQVSLFGSKE